MGLILLDYFFQNVSSSSGIPVSQGFSKDSNKVPVVYMNQKAAFAGF